MVDRHLLTAARFDFLQLALPSLEYCRAHGIDWDATEPACGGVFLCRVRASRGRFVVHPEGTVAAVCEALGPDGGVLDLVAWSLRDPARVACVAGGIAVLGSADMVASIEAGPLRVYRHPLSWLQAGARGVAILNPPRAARWLLDQPENAIAAEDDAHAVELARARQALIGRQNILVPARVVEPARVREAA